MINSIKKMMRHPLFIVVVYALFGFLWIKYSDLFIETMVTDVNALTRLQTWKGWLFIVVTSSLLYLLIHQNIRWNRKHEQSRIQFMTTAPLPLLILQDSGVVSLVNDSFTECYGYTQEDIPTADAWWVKAYPDESYRAQVLEQWQKDRAQLDTNDPDKRREFIICAKDRSEHVVRFFVVQQMRSFIIICQDITKEREMEQQLKQADKMRAVGQLAGGIAHDFNNQLAVISGCEELIRSDGTVAATHSEDLHMLRTAIDSAQELAASLLRFSRKEKAELQLIRVSDLLSDVVKVIEHTFPSEITLKQTVIPEEIVIKGNYSMLQNALLNLAINARDAIHDHGFVKIETDVDENEVVLSITDSGSGISEDILPHIFEPFYTTKEVGKGTGMGLAMVFSTIETHGGTVKVHSKVGEGTTFTISLPRS